MRFQKTSPSHSLTPSIKKFLLKAGFSSNRHHDGVWIGGKMGPSRKKQLCTFLLLEPLWISPRRCQWLAGSAHHSLPLGPGPLLQGSTLPLRSKTRKTQLRPHYCSHPTSLLCPGPMLGSQFPQISTCNLPETSAETEPLEFLRMTASRYVSIPPGNRKIEVCVPKGMYLNSL
ncbi:uncharacterized protein LOC125162118 isoform X5 [Prionailurus viverrinus]|uniref:uncharacterized protein LOC125162118 isoform X5 n=1 Tax=Prionailurus viverrinus TaxID=61388 RepID=UPI001FF2FEBD|nr:uncharacterized protein LOC125162118 isoform X5 [Prionailurus viverrinus]